MMYWVCKLDSMWIPSDLAFGRCIVVAVWLALVAAVGCTKQEPLEQPRAAAPPPSFTGPPFLYGTVGSLTRLQGDEPLLVSNYGMVTELDGTGSADVPPHLSEWLKKKMRLLGLHSARLGTRNLTPERLLASHETTVVLVEGLIPSGAVKGSPFDVLVTAKQAQTTSLAGGRLWTTEMAIEGANPALRYSRPLADARGPIYIDPFRDAEQDLEQGPVVPRGVVLAGGVVKTDRRLELVLNQPSFRRSRGIANRINERFRKGVGDRHQTAQPKSDRVIRLNVPSRFAHDVPRFLSLIGHLYIQSAPYFAYEQAQRLADLLVEQPRWSNDISLGWEALGNPARPIIQSYYDRKDLDLSVRLTALSAGVRLGDARTIDHFIELSDHPDTAVRQLVATELKHMPKSIRGSRLLRRLLNDSEHTVRLAAYRSLAEMADPIVERRVFGQRETFKCILDLVPSDKPTIFLSQVEVPRVVVFGPDTGFKSPLLASVWDNRLMLRADHPDQPVDVFFQKPGDSEPKIHQIAPAVANLVYLMAHRQTVEEPTPGLDLSFSQVAHTLHRLAAAGEIDGELELEVNPLAAAITQWRTSPPGTMRPETVGQITTSPTPLSGGTTRMPWSEGVVGTKLSGSATPQVPSRLDDTRPQLGP